MTIAFSAQPGMRILELGGGDNPTAATTCNVDIRPGPKVNFSHDFEQFPWPISSDEWDAVLAVFVLEHLSWRLIPNALKEVYRVLKPGGKTVLALPNTQKQMEWIANHPDGWDEHGIFESASEVIFGSQTYPSNFHKVYLSPSIITKLLQEAGFETILVQPYNERLTDMVAEAIKPLSNPIIPNVLGTNVTNSVLLNPVKPVEKNSEVRELMRTTEGRQQVFGVDYFNGGAKFGGYAGDGMRDFNCHFLSFQHVMNERPESVCEVGCSRGYVLKKLQDADIPGYGLEISHHCWLTRVTEGIVEWDICETPWPIETQSVDLVYDLATLEHIPEEFLPVVLSEMKRIGKRGLHGVDFGGADDGFDKSHVCLHDEKWWRQLFDSHGMQSHKVVNKELLEQGTYPQELLGGDGKTKLNIGSFTTQYFHGWVNIDIHDLGQWSQVNGYKFLRCDVRQGLPFNTGSVDLISANHFLEHLTEKDGISFLRECRRVIKSDGVMRLAVPDARLLMSGYLEGTLGRFDEINDGSAASSTSASKLWALLHEGHNAAYDEETLSHVLLEAGFQPYPTEFRRTRLDDLGQQMLRETIDMAPCLSLYCEAVPLVG